VTQGIRKTKLGLREFIKLGEFVQQIDTDNKLAVSTTPMSLFVAVGSWSHFTCHDYGCLPETSP
jgi:hypothetical protein